MTQERMVLIGFGVLSVVYLVAQFRESYKSIMEHRRISAEGDKAREWLEANCGGAYSTSGGYEYRNHWEVSEMEQAYEGNGVSSSPMLSKSDHQIFLGSGRSGAPVFSIHGDKIYRGSSMSGTPVATISGDSVYLGNAYSGNPLATISGKRVYQGKNYSGTPLATASSAKDKELLAAAALRALGH
jgi:hypothetical protein